MLKIGSLTLKSNLILSPMAGITDYPFRMLCRKFGAELAFVEMINCRSISHKSRRTKEMLFSTKDDRPLGIQILGCEDNFILRALEVLKQYKFDILDFNCACPAKKVVRRGEGAALLKSPEKLSRIFKMIVTGTKLPVTVKLRSGWDKDSVNAQEIAKIAEDAGVAGIFIHGRTRMQEYSGSVDYKAIARVKKAVKIPVIASGDIFSGILAKKMFDETGCDGLTVARGVLGNPWIFREIEAFLKHKKTFKPPEKPEIISVMKAHLQSSVDYFGERTGVMLFRKFFAWYTTGFRRIRPLRERCSRAKTLDDMMDIIEEVSLA